MARDEVFELIDAYMNKEIEGVSEQLDDVVKPIEPKKEVQTVEEQPSIADMITSEPEPESSDDESEEEELDFGDMPNGKIRYEKQKAKYQKLEEKLAALESKLNKEEDTTDSEEEETPNTSDEIENLKREAREGKELLSLQKREELFWKPFTPEERAKLAPMMELEIRRNNLIEQVMSGKMTLAKVMAMVDPDAAKKSVQVQDATTAFGTKGRTHGTSRVDTTKPDMLGVGLSILGNPKATAEQRNASLDLVPQNLLKKILSQ